MEVFEALPEDVRRELEVEYQRRSTSPIPGPSSNILLDTPIKVEHKQEIRSTTKGKEKATNYKCITQQLAPRNRPVLLSPAKSTLFAKPENPSSVNVTDVELRKLGIEPTVFAVLPVDVQREQLVMARLAHNAGVYQGSLAA
jgi:DNA repair protein REV1